jgi:hypothetical protein
MLRIRTASNFYRATVDALSRAILRIISSVIPIDFDEHRIVHFASEGPLNGIQIDPESVRGQLYSIAKTPSQIFDEDRG